VTTQRNIRWEAIHSTVRGKTRSRPKPSLRIRKSKINKSKNLLIVPIGSTAAEKPKAEITIDYEVCGI
jgi:hypothetical protein